MKSMNFLPQLRLFLLEKGAIYTVRKYKMKDELVEVIGVGVCHRIPLGLVHQEELEPYVSNSGFKSLAAWWNMINILCHDNKLDRYLYRVEKIEEQHANGTT